MLDIAFSEDDVAPSILEGTTSEVAIVALPLRKVRARVLSCVLPSVSSSLSLAGGAGDEVSEDDVAPSILQGSTPEIAIVALTFQTFRARVLSCVLPSSLCLSRDGGDDDDDDADDAHDENSFQKSSSIHARRSCQRALEKIAITPTAPAARTSQL